MLKMTLGFGSKEIKEQRGGGEGEREGGKGEQLAFEMIASERKQKTNHRTRYRF